jgi:hypothetical protein
MRNQIRDPNSHTRSATKLMRQPTRRKAEGSSAFGPETASPAATRGYAGSVAVGVDHPDTSHFMQALYIVSLKINPFFRQGQSIKIAIIRLPEVEDEW